MLLRVFVPALLALALGVSIDGEARDQTFQTTPYKDFEQWTNSSPSWTRSRSSGEFSALPGAVSIGPAGATSPRGVSTGGDHPPPISPGSAKRLTCYKT